MSIADDFKTLRHREKAPRAFDPDTPRPPWSDPDFSKHFFDLHTREATDTDQEVNALMDWLGLAAGDSVLDLGCGGGRNLLGLARRGIVGAGVDVGPYPVQIARESLAPYPMKIMLADMRASVPSGPFDAAVCLYGQITTFPVDEALAILQNTAKALAPGGQLVLELYLGPAMLDALESMESWTVTDRWMTGEYPQLVLDEHYVNWDAAEYVRTSWVIAMEDQGRNLEMVRQGSVIYDAQSLRGLLELAGFELTTLYGDYEGSEFDEDSVNMIAVARRYM